MVKRGKLGKTQLFARCSKICPDKRWECPGSLTWTQIYLSTWTCGAWNLPSILCMPARQDQLICRNWIYIVNKSRPGTIQLLWKDFSLVATSSNPGLRPQHRNSRAHVQTHSRPTAPRHNGNCTFLVITCDSGQPTFSCTNNNIYIYIYIALKVRQATGPTNCHLQLLAWYCNKIFYSNF